MKKPNENENDKNRYVQSGSQFEFPNTIDKAPKTTGHVIGIPINPPKPGDK